MCTVSWLDLKNKDDLEYKCTVRLDLMYPSDSLIWERLGLLEERSDEV